MSDNRYRIVTWHGENKSLHYIMDWAADTRESPEGAIVAGPYTLFHEVYDLWLAKYKDVYLTN